LRIRNTFFGFNSGFGIFLEQFQYTYNMIEYNHRVGRPFFKI
jgi:hypothetical protein